MVSLSTVAVVILYLIVGALVFGLLYWALNATGSVIGPGSEPFLKIGKVLLIILAAFVCIGILLSLVSGTPLIRP